MSAYAMYRLPYASKYTVITQTKGMPEELPSLHSLDGKSGFVIAPFNISAAEPVLLLHPDRTETHTIKPESLVAGRRARNTEEYNEEREQYAKDFSTYHNKLTKGVFKKIVLARSTTEDMAHETAVEQLFLRACRLYPRMFIGLIHTEKSGTWLTATPETLLESKAGKWHTMALAGTMRLTGQTLDFDNPPVADGSPDGSIHWSDKNRKEQRLVADYIESVLRPFTKDIERGEAHTVRAADIVHLRSDFSFSLNNTYAIGQLLKALHPTPAVCGLPKTDTYRFITENEHTPRSYYSGFMGPLNPDGDTHLFVSLRCMRICGSHCKLYAGGGLLADSEEQLEWNETEEKLKTMRQVLGEIEL